MTSYAGKTNWSTVWEVMPVSEDAATFSSRSCDHINTVQDRPVLPAEDSRRFYNQMTSLGDSLDL